MGIDARGQDPAATLSGSSKQLFELLRDSFPDDFAAIDADLTRAAAAGGDVGLTTQSLLLAMQVKYAPYVAQADDASLAEIVSGRIAIYRAIINREGLSICARVMTEGFAAVAQTPLAEQYHDLIMAQVAAMFRAVKSGRDNPVDRAAPSEDDWDDALEAARELGATFTGYSDLNSGVASDAACTSMVALLTAILADNVGAARLRAELMTDLALGG